MEECRVFARENSAGSRNDPHWLVGSSILHFPHRLAPAIQLLEEQQIRQDLDVSQTPFPMNSTY